MAKLYDNGHDICTVYVQLLKGTDFVQVRVTDSSEWMCMSPHSFSQNSQCKSSTSTIKGLWRDWTVWWNDVWWCFCTLIRRTFWWRLQPTRSCPQVTNQLSSWTGAPPCRYFLGFIFVTASLHSRPRELAQWHPRNRSNASPALLLPAASEQVFCSDYLYIYYIKLSDIISYHIILYFIILYVILFYILCVICKKVISYMLYIIYNI